ncbi:hypothetical protein BJY01DRAFT_216261 [Aspergillus pseudoustus]|uniref:Condensation domain-containing protein n=1 Tax=Aspergillus pseudoustus TaxID=1810923 RepID=A0ABR4JSB1_9EURO
MSIAWKQVSPTRWQRPLTGIEDFLLATGNAPVELYNGRQQYNIFSKLKVEINVPDVESALRHAWKQLRYEQPAIAATVDGERKVYETPDEAGLQQWLSSTFIVSDVSDADSLLSTPIRQATLYYLPKISELILRAHHYVIDGMGTVMFWHCLMEALVSPNKDLTFGNEYVRLSAPLDEALGYTGPPTAKQTQDASAMLTTYAQSLPSIGLVSAIGKAPATDCHNTEHTFSRETTGSIIAACKEKQISVTSAIQAAWVLMLVKHADPSSNRSRYTTANEYNLRPYLPSPHNAPTSAVGVYYAPIPFTIELPAPYMEIAQALNSNYQSTLKDNPETVNLTGHYCHLVAAMAKSPEFKAAPVSTDGLVSSLGVIEKYLRREYGGDAVKVKDFMLGLDVVLGMSAFFMYTFYDQLRLVYSFNDGYESPEKVRHYLEDVERILCEELLGLRSS